MKATRTRKTAIASLFSRREVLRFLGGTIAVSLAGCFRRQATSVETTGVLTQPLNGAAAVAAPACIVKPQQTEGPYFVDHRLNRSDIRSNPSDGSLRPGIPLRLVFQVSQITDQACTLLKGAIVDIWHCDALGVYSDVSDPTASTVGKKFLRGYQVTDANGRVEFLTIYPGWYPGRTVHIHFKIRTNAAPPGYEFTSQLYFDDALTDQIDQQSPYAARGQRTVRNDQDGIFRDGGEQLMLRLIPAAQGYLGTFDIGLEIP